MPTVIPPWLEASKAPDTYSAILPEAFKLGAQSDQFSRELALKRAEQQDQMLRAGANLGLEAGQQANAMTMNIANLRQQQEEQAQKMQLAWQEEANRIAAQAAQLDEAAYRSDLEAALQQQRIRQESLERLARTDIEKEYRKNQFALGKQKLADIDAQNKAKNAALAQKAQHIFNYQRELAAATTEEERLRVAQKWFPLIGMTGTAASGLFRPAARPMSEYEKARIDLARQAGPKPKNLLTKVEEGKLSDARTALRNARRDLVDPMKRLKQDEINKIITESQATISELEKKAAVAQTALPATIPTVTSKQEYDALAPGTIYVGKDGKRYRKP